MGERGKPNSTNPNPKLSALCEECKSSASKYTCPGCSIRSCGLACVKAHKQRTGCTGKRQLTQFVPLSQFDDNVLLSDYNMLEDVKRVAESAQRMRVKLCGNSQFRLPFPLKSLRSAATNRRTRLMFLSSGMSKREINRSFYNNRTKFISWTIEWRFHSTDVVSVDHGVLESTNLCSVIEKHLKPGPWNHKLKRFCEEPLESLKIFIRKYPKFRVHAQRIQYPYLERYMVRQEYNVACPSGPRVVSRGTPCPHVVLRKYPGPKSPFRELDIKAPIREQLANLVIIEYPVIHVFLPSHSYDFEVVKDANSHKLKLKLEEAVNHSIELSPKGVSFMEEEIKDDNSLEPKVLDLMKDVKQDGVFKIPHQTRGTNEESNKVIKNDVHIRKAEDGNLHSGAKTIEMGDIESMDFDFDFDFEQGLIDAYSDLISETNPDDFLDLEGVFTEEVGLKGRMDEADFSGVFPVEELEEGEIPGF